MLMNTKKEFVPFLKGQLDNIIFVYILLGNNYYFLSDKLFICYIRFSWRYFNYLIANMYILIS